MQKIRKILRAISEKTALPTNQPTKYQSVWFWANLETFLRISPNQEFFSKIWLSLFYLYSPLFQCKKPEKSEKTALATNQLSPNTDLIGPCCCRSKNREKNRLRIECSVSGCFFKITILPISFSNSKLIQISLESLMTELYKYKNLFGLFFRKAEICQT